MPISGTRLREIIRFSVVGGSSALANTTIVVLLTEMLRINYLISYVICFICVTAFGFALNRSWSFEVSGQARSREVGRYLLVAIGSAAIAMAASRILVAIGMPYQLAVLLSAGLMAPLNFISHRYFSFALKAPEPC